MRRLLCAVVLFAAAAGCSSPCDTLASVCAKCPDATVKAACDQAVASYRILPNGQNACQAALDGQAFASCK
jgi:hypothetical protein